MIWNIDSFPGRELILEGKSYLYFGGTSYLGMQNNSDFQDILIKNIKQYGTHYGASRKANVQFSIYDKVEKHLENFVGSESSVTMSSGYLAGQLVSSYFDHSDFKLFYAPNTHSALYHSTSKTAADYSTLDIQIREFLTSGKKERPILFLDSIDFTGLNYPDFKALQKLPLSELILVADDSHGIGVTGENGGGVHSFLEKLNPKELIVCCSLGKSLAIQAGAVFGSKHRIEQFKESSMYGGASPASPANLATFLKASSLYEEQRAKLKENIKLFRMQTEKISSFQSMKDYPVFSFSNPHLTNSLEQNGIIVTNFRYPKKDSPLMSKIVLSAYHEKKDIERLTEQINILL